MLPTPQPPCPQLQGHRLERRYSSVARPDKPGKIRRQASYGECCFTLRQQGGDAFSYVFAIPIQKSWFPTQFRVHFTHFPSPLPNKPRWLPLFSETKGTRA